MGSAEDSGPVAFAVEPSDREPGASLLAAFLAEIEGLYGPAFASWPTAEPHELTPPRGAFLVGRLNGRPVACGALKTITVPDRAEPIGELKRMYVVPGARGRGIARALVGALEEQARERGLRWVRLDTGPKQPDALHLYRSCGFVDIPDYNGNSRAAHWLEKDLAAEPAGGTDVPSGP